MVPRNPLLVSAARRGAPGLVVGDSCDVKVVVDQLRTELAEDQPFHEFV